MSRNDEYNSIEIINEGKTPSSFEFGNNNNIEFTIHKKELNNSAPRDELNPETVKSKSEHSEEELIDSDFIRKHMTEGGREATSSSTNAAKEVVSSSGQAAVQTTATAGITVSGIVVGAASIAVTAIAVATGVNIIANASARAEMVEFGVSQTEMYYGVNLFTENDDTGSYYIFVENPSYSTSQALQKGPDEREMQSGDWEQWDRSEGWFTGGVFENLTPETRYDLYIKDVSNPAGRKLFESSFITLADSNPSDYANVDYVEIEATHNQINYSLLLFTDPDDATEYSIFVESEEVLYTQPLLKGPEGPIQSDWPDFDPLNDGWTNSGSFENLTPETTYKVYIRDKDNQGRFLYGPVSYTTLEEPIEPSFNGIEFGTANYRDNKLSYHLDINNVNNAYSNIKLELSNGSTSVTFDLEPDSEIRYLDLTNNQVVTRADGNGDGLNLMTDSFSYVLSYDKDGVAQETMSRSGFDFNNGGEMESNITGVTLSGDANFKNYSFELELDGFVDDFDIIDNIYVIMTKENDQVGLSLPVDEVSGTQNVSALIDNEVIIDIIHDSFNYELQYSKNGQTMTVPGGGPISFSDTSGAINTFNGVIFSEKADYLENNFTVTLDYEEEARGAFKDFSMTITNGSSSTGILLEATTEPQTIDFDDDDFSGSYFNLREHQFQYVLYYTDDNNETQSFTGDFDYSGGGEWNSEIFGLSISNANFDTYDFDITLDYVDDFGLLDGNQDITVTFSQNPNTFVGQSYNISLTSDPQTIHGMIDGDVVTNIRDADTWYYDINYYMKDGTMGSARDYEGFTFEDTSGKNVFNSVTFENPNYQTNSFDVVLDYDEGIEGAFSNFYLELSNGENSGTLPLNGDASETISVSNFPDCMFELRYDSYDYVLSYSIFGRTYTESGSFDFNNGGTLQSSFNGLTISPTADYESYEFTVTLDYDDPFGDLNNFDISFYDVEGTFLMNTGLSKTKSPQTICGMDSGENILMDVRRDTFTYILSYEDYGTPYYYPGPDSNVYSSPFSFENGDGTTPSASVYIEERVNFFNNYTYVTISMQNDPYELLDNFSINFESISTGEAPETGEGADPGATGFGELSYQNGVPQKVEFSDSFENYSDYTYTFTYEYKGNTYSDTDTVTFIDTRDTRFNQINCDYVVYNVGTTASDYVMPISFDFQNDYSVYWGFILVVNGNEYQLGVNHGWMYVDFETTNPTGTATIELKASTNEGTVTLVEEFSQTITLGSGSHMVGAWLEDDPIMYYGYDNDHDCTTLDFYLNYTFIDNENNPTFSQFTLIFEDHNGEDVYNVDVSSQIIWPSQPGIASQTMSISSYDYQDLIYLIEGGHQMDISLKYYDSNLGDYVTISVASQAIFQSQA